MLHFPHPRAGDRQVAPWSRLGLLDEHVEHDDPAAAGEAIQRAPDALGSAGSEFEQPSTQRT
jgi:hypothetical protein